LTPGWAASSEERADPRALVRELLPYIPVVLVLLITITRPSQLRDLVLVGLLAAMVALLIARHMLTLADNIRLTAGLEDLVHERTH
ncbi:hypothetical protein DDE18_22565, partial [Nocardioides gansuensis]